MNLFLFSMRCAFSIFMLYYLFVLYLLQLSYRLYAYFDLDSFYYGHYELAFDIFYFRI